MLDGQSDILSQRLVYKYYDFETGSFCAFRFFAHLVLVRTKISLFRNPNVYKQLADKHPPFRSSNENEVFIT